MAEWGSSIFDLLRENPEVTAQTQQNIQASGYMGGPTGGVQEGRSPFGQLLQGIGIIGEPDTRVMTQHEMMLYELGKRARASDDFKIQSNTAQLTAAERGGAMDTMSNLINITKQTGMIPEQLMQYAPEARDDLTALLTERTRDRVGDQSSARIQDDHTRAATHRMLNPVYSPGAPGDERGRQLRALNAFFSLAPIKSNLEQYETRRQDAEDANSKGDKVKAYAAAEHANRLMQNIIASGEQQGLSRASIEAVLSSMDGLAAFGPATGAGAPAPDDTRVINDPKSFDAAYDSFLND